MRTAAFFIVAVGLTARGCGGPSTEASFDDPHPDPKIRAIKQAANADDRSAIPDLIEQLLSDDPLIRVLAIETLEDMTGETFGYRSYDVANERRAAIDRWVEAYESGNLNTPVPADAQAGETSAARISGNE